MALEFPPAPLNPLWYGPLPRFEDSDKYRAVVEEWKARWRKDADDLEKGGELVKAEQVREALRDWEANEKLYLEEKERERLEAERPARIEGLLVELAAAEAKRGGTRSAQCSAIAARLIATAGESAVSVTDAGKETPTDKCAEGVILHPDDEKILRALHPQRTQSQYALVTATGLSRRTVSARLTELRKAGLTGRKSERGGEYITKKGCALIAH